MTKQRAPSIRVWLLAALATSALGAGCVTRPVGQARQGETSEARWYFPVTQDKEIDLLFVIDNSESMAEEQQNLARNFPLLIDALRSVPLGPDGSGRPCHALDSSGCRIPDVHIGVVSTDLGAGPYDAIPSCETRGGDGGRLQLTPRVPGCTPPREAFIRYQDGVSNVPGAQQDPIAAVKQAFSCIAQLGSGGCGFEHTLEAARRALDPQLDLNPGFLRRDALLAVVFVTDEDDCSARDPQLFDPAQTAVSDPLGPLSSFRCFEFGTRCDVNDRNTLGPRRDCVPAQDWLRSVDEYEAFFKRLKPPGRVVLGAISGPPTPVEVGREADRPVLRASCSSAQGLAAPALRIAALLDRFPPDQRQQASICEADFGPALAAQGRKIKGKVDQCVGAALLTVEGELACQRGDGFAPGATCAQSCLHRASCLVHDVLRTAEGEERSEEIPRCPAQLWYPEDREAQRGCGASCPCWRLVRREPDVCDPAIHGSPYALDVLRNAEPPRGADAEVRCFAALPRWGDAGLAALPQCR